MTTVSITIYSAATKAGGITPRFFKPGTGIVTIKDMGFYMENYNVIFTKGKSTKQADFDTLLLRYNFNGSK